MGSPRQLADVRTAIFEFSKQLTSPPSKEELLPWLEGLLTKLTGWDECQVLTPPLQLQGSIEEWKKEREWWLKLYESTDPKFEAAPWRRERDVWLCKRGQWLRTRTETREPDETIFDLTFGWSPKRAKNSTLLIARQSRKGPDDVREPDDDDREEVTSLLELAGLLIAGSNATPQAYTSFGGYFRNREDNYQKYKNDLAESKITKRCQRLMGILQRVVDAETVTGSDEAENFKNLVADVFDVLFEGELVRIGTEIDLHGGAKRIDIVYRNIATEGFFHDVPTRNIISCPYVLVECKNYGSDPKNPEIDQLLRRFGGGRGSFGFLVCNKVRNHLEVLNRCREATRDHGGWVILFDTDDLAALLRVKSLSILKKQPHLIRDLLDEHFRLLTF
jgi:hypothetical protein